MTNYGVIKLSGSRVAVNLVYQIDGDKIKIIPFEESISSVGRTFREGNLAYAITEELFENSELIRTARMKDESIPERCKGIMELLLSDENAIKILDQLKNLEEK